MYDDPPVLIPEYVKTPSSVVRTPSPCIYIERAEDTESDEMDDMDKDSLLCSIPPTPGHSFHELSPSSHSNKRDASPLQRTRDISPHSQSWDVPSRDRRNEAGSNGCEKTGNKKRDVSPPPGYEVQRYSRLKDRFPRRDRLSHSKKKGDILYDQKQRHNVTSGMKHRCVEPDSTTSKGKDSSESDSTSKLKTQSRGGDKEQQQYKHERFEADGDDGLLFSSHNNLVPQDYRGQAKGKTKDLYSPASVVDRNVFEEFALPDLCKSSQHSAEKRPHSVESDVSTDDSCRPRPKSAKLHQKPFKSFGEKENG